MFNEIRYFFWIYRLFSRHAVTSCYITRYGVFSGRADYSADMRNTFGSLALWQIQNSDYPADMRKSIPDQEMWPSDVLGVAAPACAPSNVISRSSQSRLSRRERRHTDATGVDPATPNCHLVLNHARPRSPRAPGRPTGGTRRSWLRPGPRRLTDVRSLTNSLTILRVGDYGRRPGWEPTGTGAPGTEAAGTGPAFA
jgi:hypothetical protein